MDSSRFWQLIEHARKLSGKNTTYRVDALRELLIVLSPEDLQSFQTHYDEQIRRAFRWDLWGAAYLINGQYSDEGFRYFRDWLVSEGYRVFEAAVRWADSLADLPKIE